MTKRRINFGIMLQGPGVNMNAWKHPSVPADSSINFNYYVEKARRAEAAALILSLSPMDFTSTKNQFRTRIF